MKLQMPQSDAAFIRRIDAQSRVAIWAVNHADSPLISKIGLTHVLGGAVDASGLKILHTAGPGLALEKNELLPCSGLISYGSSMLPTMRWQKTFSNIHPNGITSAVSEIHPSSDYVYAAESLNLFRQDMDKVAGPKLCRAFTEPVNFIFTFPDFPCLDADGNFTGRYVLINGSVFEGKFFKYADAPDGAYFYFSPNKSGIWIPFACSGVFTVDANIALANPGMGWICTAGGIEQLDYKIFLRFDEVRIVWADFPDDPLISKNNFAEVLPVATEAKRRGIEMKIDRAEATARSVDDMWEAQEHLLTDQEVREKTRQYRLKIDPVWFGGLPGEIVLDEMHPAVRKVAPFWNGNTFAGFYGEMACELMQEFFIHRIEPWIPFSQIWMFIEEKDRHLAGRARAAGRKHSVRALSFNALNDPDRLLSEIKENDLIFVVIPEEGLPDGMLDTCVAMGVPVGVFCRGEDPDPHLADVGAAIYFCGSNKRHNVIIVKNMKDKEINQYEFSPDGVKVTPRTEDNLREEGVEE